MSESIYLKFSFLTEQFQSFGRVKNVTQTLDPLQYKVLINTPLIEQLSVLLSKFIQSFLYYLFGAKVVLDLGLNWKQFTLNFEYSKKSVHSLATQCSTDHDQTQLNFYCLDSWAVCICLRLQLMSRPLPVLNFHVTLASSSLSTAKSSCVQGSVSLCVWGQLV